MYMSKITSGQFAWHELWTLDSSASSSFYTGIFPWTTEVWDKETGYSLFMGKNGPDAGCHKLGADSNGQGIKPRWNTYISAANVDAMVPQAVAQGATVVVPPMDIPRVGRFAMLADPQGAVFGLLYRNEPAAARPMPPPPGAIAWNELLTSDAESALKFYSALFGWALMTSIDMGPKGAYLIFGAGGIQMGGMMNAPIPGGPLWLPYVEVDSADAVVASAVKAGATLCLGPQTVPGGGRIANFLDPQGVMFAAHSMPAATALPAAKPVAKRGSKAPPATKKPAAVARKAKSARRTGAAKVAKKKRAKPATKKSARRVSKGKAAPARRAKTAKRLLAKKGAKRAVKKSARAKPKPKPKRTRRGAKRS
jgi:uncharacterized protein